VEKFKKFIGKKINASILKDEKFLKNFSIKYENLPDSFDEFEEIEFKVDEIVMAVAVLEGKIKRIMFTKFDTADPNCCLPLDKIELEEFLKRREENLIKFFENITS